MSHVAASDSTLILSFPEPDVAVLTFDTPGKGANILSRSVLEELSAHLDELEGRESLAGLIIISGKADMFIAGADLREFAASLDISADQVADMCRFGQTLFSRLSSAPFVTIAAIDGICVGGGAELASWCDRRLMSDGTKAEFGFPEVQLGLFPGWGGTVRAPRIVGLGNAVEMITSGASIDARNAYAMGWTVGISPQERLLADAIALVRSEQATGDYQRDRQCWKQPVSISDTELGFLGATASAYIQSKTKGNYPAPLEALEVIMEGSLSTADEACQLEAEGMSKLFGSAVNASLLNVFFLTDHNKKDHGVDTEGIEPRPIKSVGVIGAGIMGAGIAAANLKRDLPVTLTDAAADVLAGGVRGILQEVAYNKQSGAADVDRAVRYAPLLNGTTSDRELAECDVIIEAVVENADVKRQLFARLEPLLGENQILASNTSTIPITELATGLQHPDRFCGIHFFNPVRRMKLVEVIRGEETSDATVSAAVAYAKSIGKSPIVVGDGPGFLVNRLLFPYLQESLELITAGAEIKAIERAAKRFGMPMGPIELYDMVGIDTALFAGRVMWEAFPDRIIASPILPALAKSGRLGQKNGKGFFSYENRKRRAQPDPDLNDFIQVYITGDKQFTNEEITSRLFLPMLLEATRVLESKLVRDVRDVDLGLIFGLGFPPFKGGLLFWADTLGADKILEMLKPLEEVGERFQPTELLLEMATSGRKFYDWSPG